MYFSFQYNVKKKITHIKFKSLIYIIIIKTTI